MILTFSKDIPHKILGDKIVHSMRAFRNPVCIISEGYVHLYRAEVDRPSFTPIGTISLHMQFITLSPDGDLAIILHNDSYVTLFDINVAHKVI
jgi:hypothetical protein